ncbi:MAG: hypothetical protein COV99_04730 [Bacteroidetes bacterium CG12_big_fil_rev_8_21_14_0_65_60_17]|nr:MAG: hypothetical protein COV99_04730 [Bacteroidetes bacterium CG12_big_fil_rev_8_21_14_0_65_60_17]
MTVLSQHEREWWLERVDAALDGELAAVDHERFLELTEIDPLLADEWALALAMRQTLASEEAPACPARVHAGIEAHVRASLRGERRDRPARRVAPWRGLVAAALVMLVVVLTLQLAPNNPGPATTSTTGVANASVSRATQDVQWALAFVSHVGRDVVSDRNPEGGQ